MRTRSRGMSTQRRVDRRDHPLDEAEELAERPVHVGDMALEREVGAVELQQETVLRRSRRTRPCSAAAERAR